MNDWKRHGIPGRRKGHSPLAGWVYIVDNHIDAGEAMDGRQQR